MLSRPLHILIPLFRRTQVLYHVMQFLVWSSMAVVAGLEAMRGERRSAYIKIFWIGHMFILLFRFRIAILHVDSDHAVSPHAHPPGTPSEKDRVGSVPPPLHKACISGWFVHLVKPVENP